MVAAIVSGAAKHPATRLAATEFSGAWHVRGDAEPAATRAADRPFFAADGGAGILGDRHADAATIRTALFRIAIVPWIVHADKAVRARKSGDPAAEAEGTDITRPAGRVAVWLTLRLALFAASDRRLG